MLSAFNRDARLTVEDNERAGRYSVTLSPMGTVTFDDVPQKAMTLDAQYEDILTAARVEGRLVATGYQGNHYDGFYRQLPGLKLGVDHASIPHVGVGLDKEVFYALGADVHHVDPERLVRMSGWTAADVAEISRNVGPFFANRFSREQTYSGTADYRYYDAFELAERVGAVYRREAPARALRQIFTQMVDRIQARLPPLKLRPRVGLVMYSNGRFTPFSLSRKGFGTAHYRAVGARDAFAPIQEQTFGGVSRGAGMDIEGLLAIDPDVLIMPFAVFESYRSRFAALEALKSDPLCHRLKAFETGRVYPGGTPLQGPLYVLFQTEMTAKQLYPEIFGTFRLDATYPPEAQLFDRSEVLKALKQ